MDKATVERNSQAESMPFVSVCSAGKNRFAFVACRGVATGEIYGFACDGWPADSAKVLCGYVDSRQEAISQSASYFGGTDFRVSSGHYARWWHADQVEKRRTDQGKNVKTTDAGAAEYIYATDRYTSDYDSYTHFHVKAWRIVKKTAKFVFIDDDAIGTWTEDDGVTLYQSGNITRGKTVKVPIAVMTDGYARRPGHSHFWSVPGEFWLDPHDALMSIPERERHQVSSKWRNYCNGDTPTPACVAALGLTMPVTETEVKTAYRQLAKQYHPDAGGDAKRFMELQRNYDQAVKMAVTN